MSPELVADLFSIWDGTVGEMPELQQEIARPASDDILSDIDRMVLAARYDMHIFAGARQLEDIQSSQMGELMGRFGWLVVALRDWSAADDPRDRQLYGALAAAAVWDVEGGLWCVLTPLVQSAVPLVAALYRIIGSRRVQPTVPVDTPIWEREHLDRLLEADRSADWPALAEVAYAFRLSPPDVGFTQAVRALCVIDLPKLAAFASGIATWFEAAYLLSALSPVDSFRLAIESRAARICFTALEQLANRHRRELSQDEEEALCALFTAMAGNMTTWPAFMQAFNRYPVRYPLIQRPLGKALASASTPAIHAYVDSVDMADNEGCARAIAICLAEFRNIGSAEQRCALWSRAYERWDMWGFGLKNDRYITKPSQSVLDFAVVGWLLECATDKFIQTEIAALEERIRVLETEWHASLTAFKSALNLLLSRYFIFCHAYHMSAESENWLSNFEQSPPAALSSAYGSARYGEN